MFFLCPRMTTETTLKLDAVYVRRLSSFYLDALVRDALPSHKRKTRNSCHCSFQSTDLQTTIRRLL